MWKIIPCNFKKGELEKWDPSENWIVRPDSDFNLSSYLYYSDIFDKQLNIVADLVDSVLNKKDLNSDCISLLQQEFESFSQYVATKNEILELQSEYNWLVSEDYIRELLKPEYKKTKRAILEISGNISVAQ